MSTPSASMRRAAATSESPSRSTKASTLAATRRASGPLAAAVAVGVHREARAVVALEEPGDLMRDRVVAEVAGQVADGQPRLGDPACGVVEAHAALGRAPLDAARPGPGDRRMPGRVRAARQPAERRLAGAPAVGERRPGLRVDLGPELGEPVPLAAVLQLVDQLRGRIRRGRHRPRRRAGRRRSTRRGGPAP